MVESKNMQFLIIDDDIPIAKFKTSEKRHGCLAELRKLAPKRNLKPLDIPDPVPAKKPELQGTFL